MDKNLKELQNFANNLNKKPEDRPLYPHTKNIFSRNEMFITGTKKIKSKIKDNAKTLAISTVMSSSGSKKD